MPSGGFRPGSGRPKGSTNKRHQVTAADVGRAEFMPLEYMLALMRDEKTEANRRDQMAIQAAPFCHPRLNAVATSNINGNGPNGDISIVQIYAVPRGARLDPKSGMITIEGEAITEMPTVEPFVGTPGLPALTHQMEKPTPIAEPLPIVELDTANVERLDAWRRRDDDDAGSGGA